MSLGSLYSLLQWDSSYYCFEANECSNDDNEGDVVGFYYPCAGNGAFSSNVGARNRIPKGPSGKSQTGVLAVIP